ncbi:DUF4012 domain-containing protein [Patescibacteria group bacterium]|nr:DUF4012 domain-containing protein [Patescibacteria group bacterium]MBU4512165.1 DUF4012 domain-containing protein [Patescibacteria group bacterium]MCG2693031.1 DUF4012 domain-containing protein [Candidatus Parcubacteria bacterium]
MPKRKSSRRYLERAKKKRTTCSKNKGAKKKVVGNRKAKAKLKNGMKPNKKQVAGIQRRVFPMSQTYLEPLIGKEEVAFHESKYAPQELTWDQFFESNGQNQEKSYPEETTVGVRDNYFSGGGSKVNLITQKETLTDFIISLPRDFLLFYKNILKALSKFVYEEAFLFGQMVQWNLETMGRAPLRIVGGILLLVLFGLSIFEKILSPLIKLVVRFVEFASWSCQNYCYVLRRIYGRIFRFFRRDVFVKPQPPLGWGRAVAAFIGICLAIILPFQSYLYLTKLKKTQGLVLGAATSAYEHLQNAEQATTGFDFGQAHQEFKIANQDFNSAKDELNQLDFLISGMLKVLPQGISANHLLEAGQAVAAAGEHLMYGLNFMITGTEQALTTEQGQETEVYKTDLATKLLTLEQSLDQAYPLITSARYNLQEVAQDAIPEANQESFKKIKDKVEQLEAAIGKLRSFTLVLGEILGVHGSRRYLVIFQNEAEIRPTGGFIGSFALIDVAQGNIKKLEIPGGGPYDLQGSLLKRVAPPRPLQKINGLWQLQDANWFPDFPTSAEKIIWFYENSGGPSVDGVIALNSGLVSDLLEIIGPIEMLEYGKVIDAQNFQQETQLAVEVEYDREENKPKQFIADLTPKLLNSLLTISVEQAFQLLTLIDKSLSEKRVLFYFLNPELQEEVCSRDWAGQIKSIGPEDDYLFVVNTNIGGGKTDNVIEQKIYHQTEISAIDGRIINTVTIQRTHKGVGEDIFLSQENINYIRVYVPRGSVLLEGQGFTPLGPGHFRDLEENIEEDIDLKEIEGQVLVDELTGTRITNEFGKTVFGNWIILEPGETAICKFRYRLPFTFNLYSDASESSGDGLLTKISQKLNPTLTASAYTLLVQKQPGSKYDQLESSLIFPADLSVSWLYPIDESIGQYKNSIKFKSILNTDKYFGAVLRPLSSRPSEE